MAAIVSMDDYALLRALEDKVDRDELREIRTEIAREGTVPWDEIKAAYGL